MQKLVLGALVVAVASCSSPHSRLDDLHVVEGHDVHSAPAWTIGYGHEFWRKGSTALPATKSAAASTSAEMDLTDTMERVNHAFTKSGDMLVSESPSLTAAIGRAGLQVSPHAPHGDAVDATVSLSSIDRGDEQLWAARDGVETFVLGNTAQRNLTENLLEHVESRDEGIELTWIVRTQPDGTGPLRIAFDVDNVTLAGRTESGHHYVDKAGMARLRISDAVLRDSAGGEWHIALAKTETGLAVTVPADVLSAARYPLAIDPVVSAEFGMDTPVAGQTLQDQLSIHMACGGGTCLAVWSDSRTGTSVLEGARFDPASGTQLDQYGIRLGDEVAYNAVIVFTGTNFLAAYADNLSRIRGLYVSPSGTAIGSPFTIATNSNQVMSASFSGQESLVTYWRYSGTTQGDLYAAVVSGTTIVATDVALATTSFNESFSRAAWDGSAFVVAWNAYNGSDNDVLAARLDASGTVVTTPRVIAGGPGDQSSATVCARTGEALITSINYSTSAALAQRVDTSLNVLSSVSPYSGAVYECAYDGTNYLLVGNYYRARISATTGAVVDTTPAVNSSSWTSPSMVYDGSRYVVAYSVYANNHYTAYASRITTANVLQDASPGVALISPAAGQGAPGVAFDGAHYLVAWTEARSTGFVIRAVLLDDSGVAVDPSGIAIGATGGSYYLHVAYGGGHYLVIWSDGSRMRGARVLPTGVVEDTTPLTLTSSVPTGSYSVASDGSRFVVAFNYNNYSTGTYSDVYAVTVPVSGAPGAPFTVTSTSLDEPNPEVACLATGRCLIVWAAGGNNGPTGWDIYMARVDGGVLLDTTPKPFLVTTGDDVVPRVASDGTNFLVNYYSYTSGSRARRVAPDATVIDSTAIPVPITFPVASFDGTNFIFATTSSASITAGQVSPAGSLLNASAITLTSGSPYPFYNVAITRALGTRRSLFTYNTYDPTSTVQNLRVKGRFVSFTSPPAVTDKTVSVNENSTASVNLAGTDSDGDALTYTIVSAPAHGMLSGTAPNVTYTPDASYNGTDSFTYKANDGGQDSNTATVSITINAVNDAPVASDASATTVEDSAKSIVLSASDVDGDALTYTIVSAPAHGTLSGSAPNLVYTPATDYNGSDSFTWTASDGSLASNVATFSLTITPVGDAPTATAQSVTTAEDTAKALTLAGTDPDGDALTYTVVSGPAHGSLSGTAPNLTYTPAANYSGSDAFTFKVNDGTLDSAAATVGITINAVNDAPVATDGSATTAEDTAKSIALSASDVDGDALTYAIVSAPAHGTLSGTAPNLTYTPAADYNGSDSFTWTANDSSASSNVGTFSLTITNSNDAPLATAQSVTTAEDAAKAITLAGTDIDGDSLTYTIVTAPSHGSLSGSAPNVTYTPTADYNGSDAFTFKVSDGTSSSAAAAVAITITAVNDAPVASNGSATSAEDTASSIVLAATDVDGDSLTYAIVVQPSHGTLSGTAPNLTYTPAANYEGSDSFTWKANDGSVASNTATFTLTITATNDAPVATTASVTTNEETAKAIVLSGSDVDSNPLTFAIVTPPSHGTLSGTAPNVTYTPVANYNGADSFTFKVNDGTVDSAPASVSITVTPVNDAPVAVAQSVTTAEDTPLNVVLTGTDVDGDTLGFVIATPPTHGTLAGAGANLIYTPASNYDGPDTFTFTASDATATSSPATVAITVTSVNDAPVVADQSATTAEDTPTDIALNGSDVDGDALTFAIASAPTHGTATVSGPTVHYTPTANYHGADSFTFHANDGTTNSATKTVSVTVSSVNDAPVAAAQTITTDQGQAASITLSATDVDDDALTYTVATQPADGTLSGTPPNLTYTAPPSFRGTTTFTFTATDGTLSSTATITVVVNNGDPSVTAAADLLNPIEGQNVTFTATAADPGGDPLTFSWNFGDGATSTDPNPVHAYADEGTYTATVTVSDGLANISATVDLTVGNGSPIVVPATGDVTGDEATELAFTANVSDPGVGDTVSLTWGWGDGSAASTGATATHTFADNGVYTVTITATDNDGATTTAMRAVTIANVPPVPTPQDALATEVGIEVDAQLVATDRAGSADPLTWSLVDGPGELASDGTYRWTPTRPDVGHAIVTARVSDDDGGTNDVVFEIEVTAAPDSGCGCQSSKGGGSTGAVMLLALGLVLRRRRR